MLNSSIIAIIFTIPAVSFGVCAVIYSLLIKKNLDKRIFILLGLCCNFFGFFLYSSIFPSSLIIVILSLILIGVGLSKLIFLYYILIIKFLKIVLVETSTLP